MTTPFSKLSKANQRIAIAQDVIAQVKAKVYMANSGSYIKFPEISPWNPDFKEKYSCQLQTAINEKKVVCAVCGIGSLFASMVKFKNHLTIGEADKIDFLDEIDSRLSKYFTFDQLRLIELAFELHFTGLATRSLSSYEAAELATDEDKRAIKFGKKYESDEKRLVAIMKNIIKNSGKFVV